jgi:hypothetical protein
MGPLAASFVFCAVALFVLDRLVAGSNLTD